MVPVQADEDDPAAGMRQQAQCTGIRIGRREIGHALDRLRGAEQFERRAVGGPVVREGSDDIAATAFPQADFELPVTAAADVRGGDEAGARNDWSAAEAPGCAEIAAGGAGRGDEPVLFLVPFEDRAVVERDQAHENGMDVVCAGAVEPLDARSSEQRGFGDNRHRQVSER